jgi:hypothetical protein
VSNRGDGRHGRVSGCDVVCIACLTGMLSEVGQFPPFFGSGSRLGAKSGVLISAAVVLVVSNVVDLSAIASVGSACSLMIFVLVGIAGYRLRSNTGASAVVILVGILATLVGSRVLRRGHVPECSADVHCDRRYRCARGRARCRVEARPRRSPDAGLTVRPRIAEGRREPRSRPGDPRTPGPSGLGRSRGVGAAG